MGYQFGDLRFMIYDLRRMKKNKGLTLVEILVVMAIIIVLVIMVVAAFNAIGAVNKARDAKRKKDLARIKVAFEEYFNDTGCYPGVALVADLTNKSNCGSSTVFTPYLVPWPCDPNGDPYSLFAEDCTKFRIITNLENKKDKDIPYEWYQKSGVDINGLGINDINYGVSSTNILWYEEFKKTYANCDTSSCSRIGEDRCNSSEPCTGNDDPINCYYYSGGNCLPECKLAPGDRCPK